MKTRNSKEIASILQKKGFQLSNKKDHHNFYYLNIDGKKSSIYTYLSHANKDYSGPLLSQIKKQLNFDSKKDLENFLDCSFSREDYIQMLNDKKQNNKSESYK